MDSATWQLCQDGLQRISRIDKLSLHAIQTAEKLLKRTEDEAAATVNQALRLTTAPYNRLLRAYARSDDDESVLKAQELIRRMKQSKHLPSPDTYTYDAALFVCAESKHSAAAEIGKAILQEMQALAKNPSSGVAPTLTSYHNIILTYANQSEFVYGAAAEAEDWLMFLSDLSCQHGHEHLRPTTRAFNHVLQAWAVSTENNGADRAVQILELMMSLKDVQMNPDDVSFATVINAFARRDRPHEAELVLKRAIDYFSNQDAEFKVDLTSCLNRTLGSWSKSTHPEAARHAKDLLDDIHTLASTSSSVANPYSRLTLRPNADSHYYYILSVLKDHSQVAVEQADSHVRSMIRRYIAHLKGPSRRRNRHRNSDLDMHPFHSIFPPNKGTIHTVMKAWTRRHQPERATEILQQMIVLADIHHATASNKEQMVHSAPVTGSFNICIGAWSRNRSPEAARHILELVNMAEERHCTDAFSYHVCINLLCRSGKKRDALEAANVLKRYEKEVDTRDIEWAPQQAIGLYTAVITALGRLREEEAAQHALTLFRGISSGGPRAASPTSKTYTALIQAFAKIKTPGAAMIVLDLYHEMKRLDADDKSHVRLDKIVMKAVLGSLVRVGDHDNVVRLLCDIAEQIVSGRKDLVDRDFLTWCTESLPQTEAIGESRRSLELEMKRNQCSLN